MQSGGEFWRCSAGGSTGLSTLCDHTKRPHHHPVSLCAGNFCFTSPPRLNVGLCGIPSPWYLYIRMSTKGSRVVSLLP